jgi:hypothetical protein
MHTIPFLKLLSSLVHVNLRGDLTLFFYLSTHPVLTGSRTPLVSTSPLPPSSSTLAPPPRPAPLFTNYIVHLVSSLTTVFNQFSSISILCSEDFYYIGSGYHRVHFTYKFTWNLAYYTPVWLVRLLIYFFITLSYCFMHSVIDSLVFILFYFILYYFILLMVLV